jgi:hypothetical protein
MARKSVIGPEPVTADRPQWVESRQQRFEF